MMHTKRVVSAVAVAFGLLLGQPLLAQWGWNYSIAIPPDAILGNGTSTLLESFHPPGPMGGWWVGLWTRDGALAPEHRWVYPGVRLTGRGGQGPVLFFPTEVVTIRKIQVTRGVLSYKIDSSEPAHQVDAVLNLRGPGLKPSGTEFLWGFLETHDPPLDPPQPEVTLTTPSQYTSIVLGRSVTVSGVVTDPNGVWMARVQALQFPPGGIGSIRWGDDQALLWPSDFQKTRVEFTRTLALEPGWNFVQFLVGGGLGGSGLRAGFLVKAIEQKPEVSVCLPPAEVPLAVINVPITGTAYDDEGVVDVVVNGKRLPPEAVVPVRGDDRRIVRFSTEVSLDELLGAGEPGMAHFDVYVVDSSNMQSDLLSCQTQRTETLEQQATTGPQCAATDPDLTRFVVLPPVDDLTVGSASLHFKKSYSGIDPTIGPLGRGWTHWYNVQLYRCTDETDDFVLARLACGRRVKFTKQSDGSYQVEHGQPFDLAELPGGRLCLSYHDGQRLYFDDSDYLFQIVDANGNATNLFYDEQHKLTSVTDAAGNQIHLQYQGWQLATVADQTGRQVAYGCVTGALGNPLLANVLLGGYYTYYAYTPQELLEKVLDDQNRELVSYSYDSENRLTGSSRGGLATSYTFDRQSRIAVKTDSLSRTTVTSLTEDGLVAWQRDASGALRQFEYHPQFRSVTRYVDPLGRETRFSRDAVGNVTTAILIDGTTQRASWTSIAGKNVQLAQVDAAGNATQFSYDATGNMTSVLDPLGNAIRMGYDERGNMTTRTDERGYTTTYQYDPATGSMTRSVDPLGNVRTRSYDAVGNVVAETDGRGNATNYEFDSLRRVTKVIATPNTSGVRGVKQYDYLQFGLVAKVTGPLGHATTNSYDAYGHLLTTEDVLGHKSMGTYDVAGRLVTLTDACGGTSTFEYDSVGRLIREVAPGGGETLTTYDPEGRVLTTRDPDGGVASIVYGSGDVPLEEHHPDGGITRYEYDAYGRCTAVVDPVGRRTETILDPIGRVVGTRRFLDGQPLETHKDFDTAGNVVRASDEAGRVTTYGFDVLGRQVSVTNPAGGVTQREYDTDGNLVCRVDPAGSAWTYTRDNLGRALSVRDPLGNLTSFAYDLAGGLSSLTDPLGAVTVYTRDALGRTTRVEYADGEWAEMEYDACGRRTVVRGAEAGGPPVEVRQAFDAAGRLSSVATDVLQKRIDYTYTAAGRRASMSVADLVSGRTQQSVAYEWNNAGALARLVPWVGSPLQYSYALDGRVSSRGLANGLSASYSYDSLGRLSGLTYQDAVGRSLGSFHYTRDVAGNPLVVVDAEGASHFNYDTLDRLVDARYPDGAWDHFTWDAVGDRLHLANEKGATDYSYDAAHRLLGESGASSASYAWDAAGRLGAKSEASGATQYSWSARGRLAGMASGQGQSSFGYLPESDQRWRIEAPGAVERRFLWDSVNVAAELDSHNGGVVDFIEGLGVDEHLALVDNGNLFVYLSEPSGTVRGLADATGAQVNSYSYRAFGQERVSTEAVANSYRFQGREFDPSSSLAYFRARYYDSLTGRFTQGDRLAQDQADMSPYAFGASNPLSRGDPLGLMVSFLGPNSEDARTLWRALITSPNSNIQAAFKPKDSSDTDLWQVTVTALTSQFWVQGRNGQYQGPYVWNLPEGVAPNPNDHDGAIAFGTLSGMKDLDKRGFGIVGGWTQGLPNAATYLAPHGGLSSFSFMGVRVPSPAGCGVHLATIETFPATRLLIQQLSAGRSYPAGQDPFLDPAVPDAATGFPPFQATDLGPMENFSRHVLAHEFVHAFVDGAYYMLNGTRQHSPEFLGNQRLIFHEVFHDAWAK